jgi:hypothetical protein
MDKWAKFQVRVTYKESLVQISARKYNILCLIVVILSLSGTMWEQNLILGYNQII